MNWAFVGGGSAFITPPCGSDYFIAKSQDGGQTNIDFCSWRPKHVVQQATPKRPLLRERSLATGRKRRALAKKHAENAE